MPQVERRRAPRTEARLLVSYRAEDAAPTPAGFVNSLNLSDLGMLLESPDAFQVGSQLVFEILLDYDNTAHVQGRVIRVKSADHGFNRIGIEFQNMSAQAKKLLHSQAIG